MNSSPHAQFESMKVRRYRQSGYWGRPTVSTMLAEHAREAPERIAVVDAFGEILTYGQLELAVQGASSWFLARRARRGDAVILAMENEVSYVVAHLAASRLGLVSVTVSAREGASDLYYVAEQTGARIALLAPSPQLPDWLEALTELRKRDLGLETLAVSRFDAAVGRDVRRIVAGQAIAFPSADDFKRKSKTLPTDPVKFEGSDTEMVVFSSGTTGKPKGIAHTYDGAGASLWNWIRTLGLTWRDTVFCPATFGHVGGSQWGIRTAIATGAPLITMHRWDPKIAAKLIGTYRCRYSLVTPTYVYDLTKLDASLRRATQCFRYWTVGGSRMDPDFVPRSERSIGGLILRGFGMSEHFMSTITRPDDPEAARAAYDGRPLPGVELQAWGDDDLPVDTGDIGEMVYRGPSLIGGYFTDPIETSRTFVNGWQRTGDLIRFDGEGFIQVVDRKKELIIRGGENISPQEIEEVLRADGLQAFAVVAVPDERLGEQVALVIERTEWVHLDRVRDVLAAAGIAKYKWPEVILAVDALPRTSLGKLQRGAVRKLAHEMDIDDNDYERL